MKNTYLLFLFFITTGYSAFSQYLNTNTFEFDINENGHARLWSNNYNHTVIDLSNDVIDNEYYVFVDGFIYEVDEDYENEIGAYTSNSITVYEENYTFQKTLLGKLSLKKEGAEGVLKIKITEHQIIIEPSIWEVPDVLKLWICQKGIARALNKEETSEAINSVVEGIISSF